MGAWGIYGGGCGYVAAGLVLLYYDYYYNDDFINDSIYLNNSGTAFDGPNFAEFLYEDIGVDDLGFDHILNASQVATVMRVYLANYRGYSHGTWLVYSPLRFEVINQLELDRPVVYVDEWNDPSAPGETTEHDIVIYGYNSNNELVAHFGWTDYSHVVASNAALAVFIASACSLAITMD